LQCYEEMGFADRFRRGREPKFVGMATQQTLLSLNGRPCKVSGLTTEISQDYRPRQSRPMTARVLYCDWIGRGNISSIFARMLPIHHQTRSRDAFDGRIHTPGEYTTFIQRDRCHRVTNGPPIHGL
jgi:hypothetical protein